MALFPCDFHGAMYRGPSSAAYPALLSGATTLRRKIRSCADCLSERLMGPVVPVQPVGYDNPGAVSGVAGRGCVAHPHRDATWAFFLNAYVKGEEQQVFYSPVCDECSDKLAEQWGLE